MIPIACAALFLVTALFFFLAALYAHGQDDAAGREMREANDWPDDDEAWLRDLSRNLDTRGPDGEEG